MKYSYPHKKIYGRKKAKGTTKFKKPMKLIKAII